MKLDLRDKATLLAALAFWHETVDRAESIDANAMVFERHGKPPIKVLDKDETEELIYRLKLEVL